MLTQLKTMLELQDSMNSIVTPYWREQGYEWYRAIWVECAEMMDHYGWKWWKKQDSDIAQVKLELIDIWHFGLSLELQQGGADYVAARMESLILVQTPVVGEFREDIEDFALKTLTTKRFDLAGFIQLCADVDLSFEELYVQYVGKNILNRFRQHNGYLTGTYQKVWYGREDNEHLVEIIEGLDTASATFSEDLYSELASRYPG